MFFFFFILLGYRLTFVTPRLLRQHGLISSTVNTSKVQGRKILRDFLELSLILIHVPLPTLSCAARSSTPASAMAL